nr:alpha/beta hydrolase [Streptococcus oricebi]
MFQPQIDFFKVRYQVIAPDLRGNGQSSSLTCQADQVLVYRQQMCWRFWKKKASAKP